MSAQPDSRDPGPLRELELSAAQLSRRGFLRLVGAAAAVGVVPVGCGGELGPFGPPPGLSLQSLTPRAYAVLNAAAERLVGPAGAERVRTRSVDPARNADELLAASPSLAEAIQQALLALEFGFFPFVGKLRPFTRLDGPARDRILSEFMTSRLALKRLVFTGVKSLALVGFYGDAGTRDLTRAPRLPGEFGIGIRDAMTYELETPEDPSRIP